VPIPVENRSPLPGPRMQQHHPRILAADRGSTGSTDYDPLAGGRGLVFGILLSTILLSGLVALAMLIWAT
jgi:hypothetical protein